MRVSQFNSSVVWVFSISAMLCGVLHSTSLHAQTDLVERARAEYENGRLDEARSILDEAVKMPQYAAEPYSWLLRGFVYKDLYKRAVMADSADMLRAEALASFFTSFSYDMEGKYRHDGMPPCEYLSRAYFNDAAAALDVNDELRAIEMFSKYKETSLRMDPNVALGEREVEFSNALGSLYSKRSDKDRTAQQWLDKAIEAYENSLSIDSMNYEANYNLSMTYHNKGTGLLLEIQEDADIQTIEMVQRETLGYFRKALFYRNRINR